MAFAGSNLALTTVNAAYGRVGGLQSLNGVVYYTSGTNVSTAVVASLPLSLSTFFNKFTASSGTLANRDNGNQEVIFFGFGTESLTNMSYVMTNGVLTQITLTWNLGSGNRNGGQGTTTNSQSLTLRDNGVSITTVTTANISYTFNLSVPVGHTFTIFIFANVNNPPSGQQNGMSLTANYSVNITGLVSI